MTYYSDYGEHIKPIPPLETETCGGMAGVCSTKRCRFHLKPQSACKKAGNLGIVIPFDKIGPKWQTITDAMTYYIAKKYRPF